MLTVLLALVALTGQRVIEVGERRRNRWARCEQRTPRIGATTMLNSAEKFG